MELVQACKGRASRSVSCPLSLCSCRRGGRESSAGQELVLTAALAVQVEARLALLLVQLSTLARRRSALRSLRESPRVADAESGCGSGGY